MTRLPGLRHDGPTRRPGTSLLAGDGDRDRVPLRLVLSAPDDLLKQCGSDALADVEQSLRRMRHEVGATGDLAFSVRALPAGAENVELSVEGRPAAAAPRSVVGDAERPGRALVAAVSAPLVRRLHLLRDIDAPAPALADRLLALGCRVPTRQEASTAVGLDGAEQLLDRRLSREILLEVPDATLRRIGEDDPVAVMASRRTEFAKWGVTYPDVRVDLVDRRPGTVRCRVNDVWLPTWEFGEDADWNAVVRQLGAETTALRHWFVRLGDVTAMLDELAYVLPELVAVTRGCYSDEETTSCLRELVRSGRRMRNVSRILWLMLEQGDAPGGPDRLRLSESPLVPRAHRDDTSNRDPVALAARVRKIAIEESWRLGNYRGPRHGVRLAPGLEERLVNPTSARDLAAAEWEAVHAVASASHADRVVTRSLRGLEPVRDALQALARPPRVMASQELPPDADLGVLEVLTSRGEGDGQPHRGRAGLGRRPRR
jgi:hypothetical protein